MIEFALQTAVEVLPFPDITWAGANPFAKNGYCLGSESGEILIYRDGKLADRNLVSKHREAINGVAFSQHWLAVTTTADINFVGQTIVDQVVKEQVELDIGGAHDVVVAPLSGHFALALGPDGILFVKPGTREGDPLVVGESDGVNYYRLLAIPNHDADLIVAAARSTGLACAEYRRETNCRGLLRVTFPGLDIIDVCSLATAEKPLAVVAAASDGTLVFFQDVLLDKSPTVVKFASIKEIDRVHSMEGHLYVLTTKGLFRLSEIVTQFLSGGSLKTVISWIALEAVDMNPVANRWFVAVGGEEVFVLDTEKMKITGLSAINGANGDASELPEPAKTRPHFEESYRKMGALA